MKKYISNLAFAAAVLVAPVAFAATIEVKVDGVVCAFCAQGLKNGFEKNADVKDLIKSVDVSVEEGRVVLDTVDGAKISDEKIISIITSAGYKTDSSQIKRN